MTGMAPNKQLFILRHAKSSWDNPGLEDHERPLASRGQRACAVIAEYLRTNAIKPQLVLCSSARRTRETLEGVAPTGEHVIERELYSASAEELLDRLRRLPDDLGSVMVIGHNPTVQMLVLRLARRDGDATARSAVERKFPTGALATLTFDCRWSELAAGSAHLAEFLTPKGLNATSRAG
jgi:phosphohistidine phosphatase